MAFNYIGIFMGIVDAFANNDKGPSPEQIILDQIRALGKMIQAFQEENRERFERIDFELATIFAQMNAQFQKITAQLENVDFDVQTLRGGLAASLNKMDLMERHLTAYLELIARQSFEQSMTQCLGYKERVGSTLPDSEYNRCVASILSFMQESKSTAISGDEIKANTLVNLADLPKPLDWAKQLNFFLQLAVQRGNYNIRQERRANPLEWARLADAFVTLAIENNEIFKRSPDLALKSILEEGQEIERSLTGTLQAEPDHFLTMFSSLLQDYKRAARSVTAAAADIRKRAINGQASETWLTSISDAGNGQ